MSPGVVAMLPPCYRHVTAMLSQCHRHVTTMLPHVVALLPPFLSIFCSITWPDFSISSSSFKFIVIFFVSTSSSSATAIIDQMCWTLHVFGHAGAPPDACFIASFQDASFAGGLKGSKSAPSFEDNGRPQLGHLLFPEFNGGAEYFLTYKYKVLQLKSQCAPKDYKYLAPG